MPVRRRLRSRFKLSSPRPLQSKNVPIGTPNKETIMSHDNKKAISPKMFLHRANGKAANSAISFLQQYRDFLTTGELAPITSSIMAQVDAGTVMPTPGLEMVRAAVLGHMIAQEAQVAEIQICLADEAAEAHTPTKNYSATVYDSKGNVATRIDAKGKVVEIVQDFNLPQDAHRFLDRRLIEQASDCYGIMQSNKILIAGELQSEVVLRQDALSRLLASKKQPFSKKVGSRDSKLSWGAKVAQSRSHFSHG